MAGGGFAFEGTDRFAVRGRLGAGGMAEIYRAYDREQNTDVALKVLPVAEGEALLRLKTEFRSLRNLRHPNLLRLGELLEQDGRWFFTMELIDGVDMHEYVRFGSRPKTAPYDSVSDPLADEGTIPPGFEVTATELPRDNAVDDRWPRAPRLSCRPAFPRPEPDRPAT